jgi:hypothetical protein
MGVKLTTHFHLVLRSRKRGAIPPLSNTPACRGAQLKWSIGITLPLSLLYRLIYFNSGAWFTFLYINVTKAIRGCIQNFPDWSPGARTANGTALCHYVLLYRYFVSQSSELCRHNPLCCFSTSVYCCCCCCCLLRYRLSPETFRYTLVACLCCEQLHIFGFWKWICFVPNTN